MLPVLRTCIHDSHTSDQLRKSSEDQQTQIIEKNNVVPCSYTDLTDDTVRYCGMDHENIIEDIVHLKLWPGKESGREINRGPHNDEDNLRRSNNTTILAGDWADSLTNINIGELLVDQSQAMGTDDFQPAAMDRSAFFNQIPFNCDSFNTAIAAHIYGNQNKQDLVSTQVSHASSLWDAEEHVMLSRSKRFQKHPSQLLLGLPGRPQLQVQWSIEAQLSGDRDKQARERGKAARDQVKLIQCISWENFAHSV